jgi:MarR family 2-MHQ and catechol resistance regulon transcriptional repressor
LPHLRDQVAVAAALHKALDGTALWVLLGLYRAFAVLDRDQAEEVAEMDLTPLQFNILTVLQRTGQPTTMGALAGMLVVKPTNLSGNINSLIERDLIKRKDNTQDQRYRLAVLTPKGKDFLAKHLPGHWRRLERLMDGLSPKKRIQLVDLLKELVDSIEGERERELAANTREKKSRAA